MQPCRLVATAEPGHVRCFRSHIPAHAPGSRPSPCARATKATARARLGDSGTSLARGSANTPLAANARSPAWPVGGVPWHRCPWHACLAAAASHLLGIADPEGDGVEVDEAASLGLKGRENGAEGAAAAFPAAQLWSRGKQQ